MKYGKCATCEGKVPSTGLIECSQCCDRFHAVCPKANKQNKICNDTLLKSFGQNSTKNNLMWMCNSCLTLYEQDKNCTMNDKLNSLLAKLEILSGTVVELRAEIAKNTRIISELTAEKNSVDSAPGIVGSTAEHHTHSSSSNAWNNPPAISLTSNMQESRENNKRVERQREKNAKTSLLIKCDDPRKCT